MKKNLRSEAERQPEGDGLHLFHPAVRDWFEAVFTEPTRPQRMGWPAIARGESALILAPTGTGKTLAAFLWCLDRLMLGGSLPSDKNKDVVPRGHQGGAPHLQGCRIVYVSPL